MDNQWYRWGGASESPVDAGTLVMIATPGDGTKGAYRAELVNWAKVTQYMAVGSVNDDVGVQQAAYAALLNERDQLQRDLAATRAGSESALNLQRLFVATADVRTAREQGENASMRLEHALLLEQIASAISRGHLPTDFHSKLREWSK